MQETTTKSLVKFLNELTTITHICKSCNKEIKDPTLLFTSELCGECLNKMKVIFKSFKIDNVKALALYNYNSLTKSLIYQYKGLKDFGLEDAFLSPFILFLKAKYSSYKICYPPSFSDTHNAGLFKSLGLEVCDLFIKTKDYKQSKQPFFLRDEIKNYIELKGKIADGKYLLVDDVMTSGNTLKACISLLRKEGIKDIKVLLISLNSNELD